MGIGTKRRTRTRTRSASPASPGVPQAPFQEFGEEEEREENKEEDEDENETGTPGAQALLASTAPARASPLATTLRPVGLRGVREAQRSEMRMRTRKGVVRANVAL